MAPSPSKGIVVTVPVLVASVAASTIFLFFLIPFLSSPSTPCNCPTTTTTTAINNEPQPFQRSIDQQQISPTQEDINWWKDQIQQNQLHDYIEARNKLRKGINPRTRAEQLQDLIQYKGISHYEGPEPSNHTALPCPGELLVEEHHSNYGEPWAGGRDVFEFLAESAQLKPDSPVLEIGCGTLRVGLHFICYLNSQHFHCLERDELSLIAAFRCGFLLSSPDFRLHACEFFKLVTGRKRPTDASAEFDSAMSSIFQILMNVSSDFLCRSRSNSAVIDKSEFEFAEVVCESMVSLGSSYLQCISGDSAMLLQFYQQMLGYFQHVKFSIHFQSLSFWVALIRELVPKPKVVPHASGDISVETSSVSGSGQADKEKKWIMIFNEDICRL